MGHSLTSESSLEHARIVTQIEPLTAIKINDSRVTDLVCHFRKIIATRSTVSGDISSVDYVKISDVLDGFIEIVQPLIKQQISTSIKDVESQSNSYLFSDSDSDSDASDGSYELDTMSLNCPGARIVHYKNMYCLSCDELECKVVNWSNYDVTCEYACGQCHRPTNILGYHKNNCNKKQKSNAKFSYDIAKKRILNGEMTSSHKCKVNCKLCLKYASISVGKCYCFMC